jgi:hypothetical protein
MFQSIARFLGFRDDEPNPVAFYNFLKENDFGFTRVELNALLDIIQKENISTKAQLWAYLQQMNYNQNVKAVAENRRSQGSATRRFMIGFKPIFVKLKKANFGKFEG